MGVDLIAGTTTCTGLKVREELDRGSYPKGIEVPDEQLAAVPLTRHEWHGDRNYTITADGSDDHTRERRLTYL